MIQYGQSQGSVKTLVHNPHSPFHIRRNEYLKKGDIEQGRCPAEESSNYRVEKLCGDVHKHSSAELLKETLLNRGLTPLFQSIVSVQHGTVFGYEALIRGPEGTPLYSPEALFRIAEELDLLVELDLLCREIAIERFSELDLEGKLFLNVTPAVILEDRFQGGKTLCCSEREGVSPERLVIELTENTPIEDYNLLRQAVDHYREMGFAIAIDDLGGGYAGFRHLAELQPELIKIDRYFIRNCHSDPVRRQLIHSICEIAHGVGSLVIAEGIETSQELDVVRSLGVNYVQGYLIAKPAAHPERMLEPVAVIPSVNRGSSCHNLDTVAHIVRNHPSVSPQAPAIDVVSLFHQSKRINSVAVINDGKPVGVVLRNDLMNLFSSRYGPSLHARKPISALMRNQPLVAAADTPLEIISEKITGDLNRGADEDFLVVDSDGAYMGVGTVIDLLKEITRLQIRNARYANPLTQLPGNVPINQQMDRLLMEQKRFCVAYCDLDRFKPFNDTYGYVRGDEVIRGVARMLQEEVDSGIDFVGHIGGDDFIIIFRSGDWERRCNRILQRFEQEAPRYYDPEARKSGGIDVYDRVGNCTFQSFISISIGVTPVDYGKYRSHHDVANAASEVKRQAKRIIGNALYIDQRIYNTKKFGVIPGAEGSAPFVGSD
jgi:diguanylate cyclase (GGDEF)-like protein